jgi:hypothetical protein
MKMSRSLRCPATLSWRVAALLLAGAIPALGQRAGDNATLPSALQVLDRYVQATGGRDALLRYKSTTIHQRFQVPAQKLDVEAVSYSKGLKTLQKTFLPGGKVDLSGYDGKVAWDVGPDGKVTLYHGDIVKTIARDADMYYHLHVLDYFKQLDVVGVKEFAGHQCYDLKGVNNWNQPNEQFYDTSSGLLIGYHFNTKWRGGPGDTTATFEDYKNFGGVLIPVKTIGRDATGVSISLVTSVTYDDVGDSIFVLPDAVKTVVAQEKGAQ